MNKKKPATAQALIALMWIVATVFLLVPRGCVYSSISSMHRMNVAKENGLNGRACAYCLRPSTRIVYINHDAEGIVKTMNRMHCCDQHAPRPSYGKWVGSHFVEHYQYKRIWADNSYDPRTEDNGLAIFGLVILGVVFMCGIVLSVRALFVSNGGTEFGYAVAALAFALGAWALLTFTDIANESATDWPMAEESVC